MWPVNAMEWGKLFKGEWEPESFTRQYRPKPTDYGRWLSILQSSPTGPEVLSRTESDAEFFRVEKDLAMIVPRQQMTEFFYSLKNGFVAPGCPAQFIYFAKAIYEKYQVCNLIGPMLPKAVKFGITRGGYFGSGYTAYDAICNFVTPHFKPITDVTPIVRVGEWYEAYLPRIDMVAALPEKLGAKLTAKELEQIVYRPGMGLILGNQTLLALGEVTGVTRGVFDLRAAV